MGHAHGGYIAPKQYEISLRKRAHGPEMSFIRNINMAALTSSVLYCTLLKTLQQTLLQVRCHGLKRLL